MKLKLTIYTFFCFVLATLTGCATYKTTLTDAQGRSVTCEASGKSGIVTGVYLRQGFEDCVNAAEAKGFNPTQPIVQNTLPTKQ